VLKLIRDLRCVDGHDGFRGAGALLVLSENSESRHLQTGAQREALAFNERHTERYVGSRPVSVALTYMCGKGGLATPDHFEITDALWDILWSWLQCSPLPWRARVD
jgi:hypothetical protein